MNKSVRKYWLSASIILVVMTGCLRPATGGELETPESRALSTATPLPTAIPTNTPEPTDTSAPTERPTQRPTDTASPMPVNAQSVQDTATSTEEPTSVAVAQVPSPTLSELLQQATQIIAEATQRALDQTATAQGPVIALPTFTPTPDPLLQPTATTVAGPLVPGSDCVHEVIRGDTLYRLSVRYGVLVVDIAQASGVTNIDRISVGQKLTISWLWHYWHISSSYINTDLTGIIVNHNTRHRCSIRRDACASKSRHHTYSAAE